MPSNSSRISVIVSPIRGVARVWSVLVWLLAFILVVGSRNSPPSSNLVNSPLDILIPIFLLISLIGLVPMAAALAGHWRGPLALWARTLLIGAAIVILFPGPHGWDLYAGLNLTNLLGVAAAAFLLRPGRLKT